MKRILCYGDSNTFGTGPMETIESDPILPRGARWADVLAAELGENFEVAVEGLGGRTTVFDDPVEGNWKNGLTMLKGVIGSHRPIDLLIVCLGTNDLKARHGLLAQEIARGMGVLLREANATGHVAEMLVMSPPPVKERGDFAIMFEGAERRGAGLAHELERFATNEGARFFDAGSVIESCELDGIHWTAESHGVLGRALADVVRGR